MDKDKVLAVLRLYLGIIFALALYPKLQAGAHYVNMMTGFVTHVGMQHAQPFYQIFLRDVVLQHASPVATLTLVGEAVVALSMVTGTATRLGALVAIALLTNYMFSKGLWWWSPASNDAAFSAIALTVGLCAAGRTFGIDRVLARRWPKVPLW